LAASAERNDAAAILTRLLSDQDFDIRLAAYEQLRELDDPAVIRRTVARSFSLDQIPQSRYRSVFVSRSGESRVALFGGAIRCRDNIFVQSADGNIMLNATTGQAYVSVIRKRPGQSGTVSHLKSPFDLANIIRVLCEDPPKKGGQGGGGLGVPYCEMVALVKQMSDMGVFRAPFNAGPLPKIGVIVKK
jgi:hypothetical protein